MQYIKLKNGMRVVYKNTNQNITSFCIGVNAGALEEKGFPLGTAHFVEHMVFKGTGKRTESEINLLSDEIFGFENAMTNYPYCIYYGTTLSEDFERGLELFSDIVLNPIFKENGFIEEKNVILEELKEWKDDVYQSLEDELFLNAFSKIRIKELIIGNEESINHITIEDLKNFYNKYYKESNMVISVVSSLSFNEINSFIEKYFGNENKEQTLKEDDLRAKNEDIYEDNKSYRFVKHNPNIKGAKIKYCYPIHNLNYDEIKILRVFNSFFGEGTSSILYDNVRTKNGLAYEIGSEIKNERGIKLFSITLGTSKDKVDKVLKIIDSCIDEVKNKSEIFAEKKIKEKFKNIKLKKLLRLEKSIQLAKDLTSYELMYNDYKMVFHEVEENLDINGKDIVKIAIKVLHDPIIQILK